jgi:hypothetical protein
VLPQDCSVPTAVSTVPRAGEPCRQKLAYSKQERRRWPVEQRSVRIMSFFFSPTIPTFSQSSSRCFRVISTPKKHIRATSPQNHGSAGKATASRADRQAPPPSSPPHSCARERKRMARGVVL